MALPGPLRVVVSQPSGLQLPVAPGVQLGEQHQDRQLAALLSPELALQTCRRAGPCGVACAAPPEAAGQSLPPQQLRPPCPEKLPSPLSSRAR